MIGRRHFLAAAGSTAGVTAFAPRIWGRSTPRPLPALFDDLAKRTFHYFWDTGNPANGLVPDRWPSPSVCSIAAVGFALSAYPVGVERGWISRQQARQRTLTTLEFFAAAPMGAGPQGVSGYKGFFYHFIGMKDGLRIGKVELSSVDSTLLFLGMLHAGEWFDGDHPDERRIRVLSETIVARAEWPWFQQKTGAISMGWHPESGFIERGWTGYNEGMMVVLLALGSARHPVGDGAWDAWTATYPGFWRGEGPTQHLAFAPLFGHQYSQMWIDFRGLQDAPMRLAGLDYFENSRRATIANRAYCLANPKRWESYGHDLWGLTACDGPGSFQTLVNGAQRQFYGYAARGPVGFPDGLDDGTIAPTAALGSLAFAPEICVPAAQALRSYGEGRLYGRFGFVDSFNPSMRDLTPRLDNGKVDPHLGWIDTDCLGIDQGPILGAIANYRDEGIWRPMRRSAVIRRGLTRAGFTGGWLTATRSR